MIIIKGKSASSGVAVAPIAAKPDASDEDRVTLLTSLKPEAELRRFHAAQEKVIAQLGELAEKARQEIGEEEAGIFETHQMMLQDPDLVDMIEGLMTDNHLTAEGAVERGTATASGAGRGHPGSPRRRIYYIHGCRRPRYYGTGPAHPHEARFRLGSQD